MSLAGYHPGWSASNPRAHPNANAYFGAEPRGTGKIPGKRKLTLHLLYSQEHLASLMWICHPQQTLKCTWEEIAALRKKTTYHAVCRYHLYIRSDRLPERHYKIAATLCQVRQARKEATRLPQLWLLVPMNHKYVQLILEHHDSSLLFTWQHKQALQEFHNSKSTVAISTFPSKQRILCGGKHTTSTPASPRIVRA